ncbi:related to DUF775 domain protein [Rhynchosporium secalis]|uniref:Related to DUF775 domain protein n=1 Tax=Rhynchosporium secalis TaxID=38038 RepID=A0A1E1MC17_RHYSE|nr:related to DUF775 domain protein [Rhynchosporium secalis]
MGEPLPQLFGVIPTGAPCITTPTSVPSQTSFVYTLPRIGKGFSHIVVFLLPGITLPPDTAAAVYISLPSQNAEPAFKFLGGIGLGKESAVFKLSGLGSGSSTPSNSTGGIAEVDMDADDMSSIGSGNGEGTITLGISLEPASAVSAQIASLRSTTTISNSQALVLSSPAARKTPDTLVLAQRIIKNAFNFLASFSGNVNGGVEVVPLKAFEEWWRKFEGRVRNDPGFLERDDD